MWSLSNCRPRLCLPAIVAAVLAACGGGGNQDVVPTTGPLAAKTGEESAPIPVRSVSEALPASTHTTSPSQNERAGGVRAVARTYIVQMAEPPAIAYQGGVAGYAATQPAKGKKIDPDSPDVSRYVGYLTSKHDAALAGVGGGGRKAYSYSYAFNGFAAKLTEAQAAQLAATAGVLAIVKDEARQLDTSTTPRFLGLSGAGGFWETTRAKGENVVIGIVDSGIWPEHPSFSDRTGSNGSATQDGKLDYQQIPGWHGKCTPGEQFDASDCNQKLI